MDLHDGWLLACGATYSAGRSLLLTLSLSARQIVEASEGGERAVGGGECSAPPRRLAAGQLSTGGGALSNTMGMNQDGVHHGMAWPGSFVIPVSGWDTDGTTPGHCCLKGGNLYGFVGARSQRQRPHVNIAIKHTASQASPRLIAMLGAHLIACPSSVPS